MSSKKLATGDDHPSQSTTDETTMLEPETINLDDVTHDLNVGDLSYASVEMYNNTGTTTRVNRILWCKRMVQQKKDIVLQWKTQ
ncbi:hypothetical protein MTO96_044346 [Rhipicephalus appendiculatus]